MPCQYYCVGADGVGFGVGMINTGVHMYAVDGDDEKTKHRHVVLHVATSLGPARDPDMLTRRFTPTRRHTPAAHEPHGAVLVGNVGLLDVLDDDSLTSRRRLILRYH